MKRELRCACHGDIIGYEVTPGDDQAIHGPCTESARTVELKTPFTPWPSPASEN